MKKDLNFPGKQTLNTLKHMNKYKNYKIPEKLEKSYKNTTELHRSWNIKSLLKENKGRGG